MSSLDHDESKGISVVIEDDFENGTHNFKITMVLEKEEYERIKGISAKLGMKPASWMRHVVLTKLGIVRI